jgi:hypothetical protein
MDWREKVRMGRLIMVGTCTRNKGRLFGFPMEVYSGWLLRRIDRISRLIGAPFFGIISDKYGVVWSDEKIITYNVPPDISMEAISKIGALLKLKWENRAPKAGMLLVTANPKRTRPYGLLAQSGKILPRYFLLSSELTIHSSRGFWNES